MSSSSYSIVEFYPGNDGSRCGYCKSLNSSYSDGMWAHSLTVEDYQDLIDRGWRRSGKYCYKSRMNETCCPLYTIRCNALDLKLTKSQKKVIKRVNRFLSYGDVKCKSDKYKKVDSPGINESAMEIETLQSKASQVKAKSENLMISTGTVSRKEDTYSKKKFEERLKNCKSSSPEVLPKKEKIDKEMKSEGKSSTDGWPKMQKAKLIRRERKKKKLMNQGMTEEEAELFMKNFRLKASQGKSLEELIESPLPKNPAHVLNLAVVPVRSTDCALTLPQSHKLYVRYQMAIHKEPVEECSLESFKEFLIGSPLEKFQPSNGPPEGYGSFHQQYWLDDRLIAVGVIDILPKCVSSVYFYYDPDYSFLSMGSYGSLRELYFTRSLQRHVPELKYYYMGFYIHSCPKMRYKASWKPSFLLCPESYSWHPSEECQEKIDQSKYSRLDDDKSALDEDGDIVVNDVTVLSHNRVMTYSKLQSLFPKSSDLAQVEQYARLVGMKCARRMLLYQD